MADIGLITELGPGRLARAAAAAVLAIPAFGAATPTLCDTGVAMADPAAATPDGSPAANPNDPALCSAGTASFDAGDPLAGLPPLCTPAYEPVPDEGLDGVASEAVPAFPGPPAPVAPSIRFAASIADEALLGTEEGEG